MVIIYCPFCGKELRYSVTVHEYGTVCGDVSVSEYPDDRGDCRCTYHDDDGALQSAVQDVAQQKLLTQLRLIVENSEFR
jgi:hypothetical protein